MLKRVTRIHLSVAKCQPRSGELQWFRDTEAGVIRRKRKEHSPAEARRYHRTSYGPLLPLD